MIAIDPDSRTWESVLDLTDALRSVTEDGWGNNVEGIAVSNDGTLYLVSDNAVTGVIDDPEPPLTDERTLLMRIPVEGVDERDPLANGVRSRGPVESAGGAPGVVHASPAVGPVVRPIMKRATLGRRIALESPP